MRFSQVVLGILLVTPILDGCEDPKVAEGIFSENLGEPMPSATSEQRETFDRGMDVLKHRFTPEDGLGPAFNVTFCGACHEKPVFGGSAGRYRDFLLVGRSAAGAFTATGVNGVQVQYEPDGAVRVPTDEATNVTALRSAIPFFGVGVLAELSNEVILANADPDDEDGDGISGRPNYDRGFVGRFGRKAQTVSIEGFIRGPLFNHLGITTDPLSEARKAALPVPSGSASVNDTNTQALTEYIGTTGHGQAAAPDESTLDEDGVPDPEMSEQDLFDLISMAMLLGAPKPEPLTEETEAGLAIFEEVGCAKCHVQSLEGPRGLIPLYSDLLLHDMGEALSDNVTMKEASGSEFRTQPLWGITAVGPYLHDGRADTLEEAIMMHGGEAEAVRDAYAARSEADRAKLVRFLESLGGSSQKTAGLVPPNEPLSATGSYGGPWRELNEEEQQRFLLGREVFDRDFALSAGLGPRTNGDACRGCHFDPVIGGTGPSDVNVIRHGSVDTSTTPYRFTPPSIGTMAHKFTVGATRPPADETANVFENRQTPLVLGMGLLELISESEILNLEDPMDSDGDGIQGIAHRLPDGRLGRFGWKANVPSTREFARDAMFNEMGVTLPPEEGLTFGDLTDSDEVPDPELSLTELQAIAFYMELLAPPPPAQLDASAEQAGLTLFEEVGCAACHIPSLPTDDGMEVRAYTDLLLHDVVPANFVGVPDGTATMRHFRTPPLWGLRDTAPYMHDGRAYSIEEAIARHESEAQSSRENYEGLSAQEREVLLTFLRTR